MSIRRTPIVRVRAANARGRWWVGLLAMAPVLGPDAGAQPAGASASALAAQSGGRERAHGMTLKEARELFMRVERDGDKKLALGEADSGGIEPSEFASFDVDRDGHLNAQEFLVALQAARLARRESVASDLAAEANRVRALWQLQRARGPSQRIALQRSPATKLPKPTIDRVPVIAGLGLERLRAANPRAVTSLAAGGALPARGGPADMRRAASLEQRARAAQDRLEAPASGSTLQARDAAVGPGGARRTPLAPQAAASKLPSGKRRAATPTASQASATRAARLSKLRKQQGDG